MLIYEKFILMSKRWKQYILYAGIIHLGLFCANSTVRCSDPRVVSYENFPDYTVLLTFDDGPAASTETVLNALNSESIKAIFFIVGENGASKQGQKILERISKAGHMIANHGYHHVTMTKLTEKEQKNSLNKTNACIAPFQKSVLYFRPPGGACNSILKRSVSASGMRVMFWNIDPRDWKKDAKGYRPNSATLQKRILEDLEKQNHRGIILLHDLHLNTALSVPVILKALKERGYRFMNPEDVSRYQELNTDNNTPPIAPLF